MGATCVQRCKKWKLVPGLGGNRQSWKLPEGHLEGGLGVESTQSPPRTAKQSPLVESQHVGPMKKEKNALKAMLGSQEYSQTAWQKMLLDFSRQATYYICV